MRIALLFLCATAALWPVHFHAAETTTSSHGIHKVKDMVIYKDEQFHSAFPSLVRRPDGELLLAFRRAPDWRPLGAKSFTHTDPNSYLVMVRSTDSGETWTKEPQLFAAHPWGGSQDPCMVQLRDGTILCASYAWANVPTNVMPNLKTPMLRHGNFAFLGGYLLRSRDGAKSWETPIIPAHAVDVNLDIFGKPVPAYNRGAMCEGKDGRLYWVIAANDRETPRKSSTHLMISEDKGSTWKYSCPVAEDEKITFNETSIYETPKGDLVAFLRTGDFDDHTCIARSTDHGKTFQKWQDAGFQGHPHYALQLPDQRVLLVYGYRHKPIGLRARVLDAECTNFTKADEIVIRDDGGAIDLGYPWATMISPNRVLVVYYFNIADKTRFIAGSILQID